MAETRNIEGNAFKNGSAILLARVVGAGGAAIVRTDIAAIRYTIALLDDDQPDQRTTVEGHDDIALSVNDALFNSLQLDAMWTVDAVGYNFRHVVDVTTHPAFATAGRRYLVEHRLTPVNGQVIIVRFRINVI